MLGFSGLCDGWGILGVFLHGTELILHDAQRILYDAHHVARYFDDAQH